MIIHHIHRQTCRPTSYSIYFLASVLNHFVTVIVRGYPLMEPCIALPLALSLAPSLAKLLKIARSSFVYFFHNSCSNYFSLFHSWLTT